MPAKGSTYRKPGVPWTCPQCKVLKEPQEYYVSSRRSSGRSAYCKPCTDARNAKYRQQRLSKRPKPTKLDRDPSQPWPCATCKEIKAPQEFGKSKNSASGLLSVCKTCKNAKSRENYSKKNPKKKIPRKYDDDWHCKRCDTIKESKEFPDDPKSPSGKYSYCKPCKADFMREAKKKISPENLQKYNINRSCKKYGITIKEYYQTLEDQDGRCAICREELTHSVMTRLVIDHCHSSGKFRALLCPNCNAGLGLFQDNPDLLIAAANYLNQFKDLTNAEFVH